MKNKLLGIALIALSVAFAACTKTAPTEMQDASGAIVGVIIGIACFMS